MKTGVSVPDDLFRRAASAAKRLHISRSELYVRALAEFLDSNRDSAITERLNEVYAQQAAKMDPGLHQAQLETIGEDGW